MNIRNILETQEFHQALSILESLENEIRSIHEGDADEVAKKKQEVVSYIEQNKPFTSDGQVDMTKHKGLVDKVRSYLQLYVKVFKERLQAQGQNIKEKLQAIVTAFSQMAGVKLSVAT